MLTHLIRDPRDLPVVRLVATLLLLFFPLAALLFVHFSWALAVPYLTVLFFRFSAPFAGLIHETTHRPVFTARALRPGRVAVEWIICPMFGVSPYGYRAQHVGMHHPENNLAADASATLGYRRDSALDFLRYFLRFLFFAHWEVLLYLRRTRKQRLAKRAAVGIAAHHLATALALVMNWRAALVVLVLPWFLMRFAFAVGNWVQHGFVDPQAPGDNHRSVTTCIVPDFNRITFNSGFHATHHFDMRVHWSELPAEFERNLDRSISQNATIFRGLDYGQVWWALMLHRYHWLAAHHVDRGGGRDAIARRLREKAQPVLAAPARPRRFAALAAAVLALLIPATSRAAEPTLIPDAALTGSSGAPTRLHRFEGKPLVLFYEDPRAADGSQPTKVKLKQLSERYGMQKFVDVVAIINLEGLNWWPARPLAMGTVRAKEKEAQVTVLVDLTGELRKAPWALDPTQSTLMVVSPRGELLFQTSGPLEGESFDTFKAVLERLLAASLSREEQQRTLQQALRAAL